MNGPRTLAHVELFDPRDHADTCAVCFDGECPGVGCVDPDDDEAVEELQRLVLLGRMVDSLQLAIWPAAVCSCGGSGWVEDKNFSAVGEGLFRRRERWDGLIPCGFCNKDAHR